MSDEFKVERAQRSNVKLRLAIQGPSNSGKTATALMLAMGMVDGLRARGKLPTHLEDCYIGLLDTENDSASLYDHLGPFDRVVLKAPYTVERYLKALAALTAVGYPIIIIDQISHEWTGPGGILDQVTRASDSNDYAKWNGPSQQHDKFIEVLLNVPVHLIVTMRAKTEYVLEKQVKNGREVNVPTRIGMAPQQRAGSEYEFTTLLDLTISHPQAGLNAVTCLKDRMQIFEPTQVVPRMGPEWGMKMMDWVYSAKKVAPEGGEAPPAMRALAMAEAAKRLIERAPNQPDLETIFLAERKKLRNLSVEAGEVVIVPLIDELVAAAGARKAVLQGTAGAALVKDLDPTEVAKPATEPVKHDPLAKAKEITERIAASRPGLFQGKTEPGGIMSEMADDLPWQD